MANKRVIGNPTPRVEGEQKVTGRAIYAVDTVLPDMLWGKAVRSPIPYGRIKSIDTGRALAVAGVKTIVTGKDVEGMRIGRRVYDMPILAEDVVRFIGEKVVGIAAETEAAAEEAASLVEVEYEEWEPILDPVRAMEASAPILHPDVMNVKGLPAKLEAPSNVFITMTWKKGDVAVGFKQADLIVENTFTTNKVHHAYLEPHSCLVKAHPDGSAEIWSCSKVPFAIREQVANAVRVPPEKLTVHPVYIGGDFGGKGDFMDIPLCYFLSLKSGYPVKMVMDYEEEFIAGNPRHAAIVKVKTGVRKDGTITAHQMEFIFDSGAYGAFKPNGFLNGPRESAGPYNIPHVLIEEKMVYTNQVPCGHMRSPGEPQGFFANESQMDLVARALGMDPVEFRKKNLMHDGDTAPSGEEVGLIRIDEALDRALKESGFHKPKPKNLGRGVALVPWYPNGGQGAVTLTLSADGGITLASALLDQGTGTYTVLSEIVAEELKIPLARIKTQMLDTKSGVKDTGVGASRATRVYGNAAYDAATKLVAAIKKAAAARMGGNPDELIIANGGVLHPRAERRLSYAELVEANGGPISVTGQYSDSSKVHEASACAQVAEVRVDPETGVVKLNQFTSAHVTGTVLNPLMHQGQIEGGAVMGIGYALMEHLVVEDGKVTTANFGDYKIPTIQDIPRLKTSVKEIPRGPGPYESMAIGETANIPVAAAIANAVEDAVGVRIKSLPITAEKVLAALREKANNR
ncbi:MAG TPA: xanthine dehydrogenase family protein molybdopterin-binding subunit [Candidatus Acidoferrales bacterium]|nr:xanthine dehydrogenase family protein molybdopterin-binding subunit [Candidatus Acidoferrales bacterium]